jgi:hypothetical protein
VSALALVLRWARADREDDQADTATALVLARRLAVLAETDPGHPLVVVARSEIADARREEHRRLREAALDVHGGDRQLWRTLATEDVPHEQLVKRRRRPGPMPGAA